MPDVYIKKPLKFHSNSLLTEDDVIEIRRRYANGETKKEIYKDYSNKIGIGGIKKIVLNITWKNV